MKETQNCKKCIFLHLFYGENKTDNQMLKKNVVVMLHFYFHLIISITLVFQCCPSIKMNPFMRFKPHLATTRVSMLYTIVICAMFPRSSQVDSGAMEADVPLNLCKPLYHFTRFVQLRGLFLKVVGAKQT